MREGIHPEYHQATVTCNCGNTFVTGSTNESIHVEICSKCHPFYTGQQKAAQARGRVDKFNKSMVLNKNDTLQAEVKNISACLFWCRIYGLPDRPARISAEYTETYRQEAV